MKHSFVTCDMCNKTIQHDRDYYVVEGRKSKLFNERSVTYTRQIDMCEECFNKLFPFIGE